jgi:trans-aconitate methyltransferase
LNPWLAVPLADYEGHMSSASVQQLTALSDLFAEALRQCRPESVILLGVAGGNGLERIDPEITTRVAGVDINPDYLDAVGRRFPAAVLVHADLSTQRVDLEPAQLVHAALVFEHAGTDGCLENALSLVAPQGRLSVVLQLPSEEQPGVSATRFTSIESLRDHFQFIDRAHLRQQVEARGLRLHFETRQPLPGGKAFWMGIFSG